MNASAPEAGQFGRFEILIAERRLHVDGQPVALGSRAFDLLAALVTRRDRVVPKDELIDVVWLPHGPSYPTGDVVCPDRGPCGDEYKEDMRTIAIPAWAKFLRNYDFLTIVFLLLAGLSVGSKGWGKDEAPKEFDQLSFDDDDDDFPEISSVNVSDFAVPLSPASGGAITDDRTNEFKMDDPIELAARALARALGQPATWKIHVPTVRIVVEALADPTSTMIDAGNEAMRAAWAARGLSAPAVAGDAAVAAAWEAMIDRILGHV